METQFRGSEAMLLAQQQLQERERLRLERLRAAAQIEAMSAPRPAARASQAADHWVDRTAYGRAHAAGAAHHPADRPAYRPDGAPNRLNLTQEQLAAVAQAEEASRRSLPYLAAPPLAGAVIAGGLLGAPVAMTAARAAAAQANKSLADQAIRRIARPGYEVRPSKPSKGGQGYRYRPRGQSERDHPDEELRLMPGDRASPNPAQQELYLKQILQGGRVLDRNGQVIAKTSAVPKPSKAPESHLPAWEWIRKEIMGGGPTRPAGSPPSAPRR